MADMIEILIGGEPVKVPKWALQETQEKIFKLTEKSNTLSSQTLAVIKALAKESGVSSKQLKLLEQKYTKTQKVEEEGLREQKKYNQQSKTHRNATKDFQKTLKKSTANQVQIGKTMVGKLKSIGKIAELDKESMSTIVDKMGDVVGGLPFIGGTLAATASGLGMTIGVLEEFGNVVADLNSVGIGLHGNLMDMRSAAATAGMSFSAFGEIIAKNSMTVRAYGNNMQDGAKKLALLQNQFAAATKNLGHFGLTNAEMTNFLAEELEMRRRYGQMDRLNTEQLAASTKNLLMNQTALAELTGTDRDDRLRARQAALTDVDVASWIYDLGETAELAEDNLGSMAAALDESAFADLGPRIQHAFTQALAAGEFDPAQVDRELMTALGGSGQELFKWVKNNLQTLNAPDFNAEFTDRIYSLLENTRFSTEEMRKLRVAGSNMGGVFGEILEALNLTRGINVTAAQVKDAVNNVVTEVDKVDGSMVVAGVNASMERMFHEVAEGILTSSLNMVGGDIEDGGAQLVSSIDLIGDVLNNIIDEGLIPLSEKVRQLMLDESVQRPTTRDLRQGQSGNTAYPTRPTSASTPMPQIGRASVQQTAAQRKASTVNDLAEKRLDNEMADMKRAQQQTNRLLERSLRVQSDLRDNTD